MDQQTKIDDLKKYMLENFGITPANIDQELTNLKLGIGTKLKDIADLERKGIAIC